MRLNQRITTKWMLTFVLLMVAVVNAAENKSTEKKTVSEPQASPASPLSRVTPRDEIYIDDEGLEGSGGRGEIHDDLEKEPDYSGSGFGPDDEDSSPGHHHHNTNTHYSPSSGISSSNSGSSSNIGSSNTNSAGIINSNSNIGSGINTIGKDSSTNRKDTTPTIGSKHDTDEEYSFGGVVAGSGDGNDNDDNDDKYDDNDNDDTDDLDPDFDNDNDHTDKIKNIDPYNHDKSDRKHIHDDDDDKNNNNNNNNNNHDDDDENDDDDDDDESIYTEVTDPNESDSDARLPDRSGETNINKEISVKTNNELGIDLDHTSRNNFPTDSNTNIGAGGVLGGNEVLIMNTKNEDRTASFFAQPGILAAVIGGAVVGLLCAILVVMFIVYRMRKKDEGSYALDEPKRSPAANSYAKNVNNREFYA